MHPDAIQVDNGRCLLYRELYIDTKVPVYHATLTDVFVFQSFLSCVEYRELYIDTKVPVLHATLTDVFVFQSFLSCVEYRESYIDTKVPVLHACILPLQVDNRRACISIVF